MKTEPGIITEAGPYELETERYEMRAKPQYHFDVDRRDFFRALGAGLVVLTFADVALAQQESGNAGRGFGRGFGGPPTDLNSFVHIGEDGAITAFTGKAEVGQNVRTSMTMAVAEELRVPVGSIKLIVGDTDLTPYDIGTFGSLSTPQMAPQLHQAAAGAREALLDLAAAHFQVDRAELTIEDGKIFKSNANRNEAVSYGQLTKGQKLVRTAGASTTVTAPKDWKVVGTSVPKVNGRDFVTGSHKYASDMKLPGMLYGRVLRATMFDAKMTSLDTSAAEAMKGVTVVKDGNFVGVTAPDPLMAAQAIEAIKAEWSGTPKTSSAELFAYLKKNASTGGGRGGGGFGGRGPRNIGSMEAGLAAADSKLQQTYTIAHIAHVPLEPRSALAEWNGDKVTIYAGSQRPFGIRSDVAQAFKIPDTSVHLIVPDTGSGYGGKHGGSGLEAEVEAARLAKAVGKPVKVAWTRQDEFTWAYCRPAGVIEVSSGVTKDGKVTAWEFHNYHSGDAAVSTPYDIPNQKTQVHTLPTSLHPLTVGSYKGLAGTANHFARETHMDELANEVKMDPLEFRLKNCTDARLRTVLETAAKAFGWGAKASEGHGFGIAGGTEKDSYIACCAEVATDKDTGSVKVVRVVTVFDCGAIRNPDQLKNQVEGAQVMGLGGALFESLDFKDGMITNPFLADYRVPRFHDMPKLEVILLDHREIKSAGAGETPIMAIAPAIGNAIFNATGIRLRSMPLAPEGLNMAEAKKG